MFSTEECCNVSDSLYDSRVDELKNLHLLSVFVVFVWTSSPWLVFLPCFLVFIPAFTLYLKYMALIECVINREEDKGNYKSLNLHFILGFWYCTATSLTWCVSSLAFVLIESRVVVVVMKIWPFHAAAWFNLDLIALVFSLVYHGRMLRGKKNC